MDQHMQKRAYESSTRRTSCAHQLTNQQGLPASLHSRGSVCPHTCYADRCELTLGMLRSGKVIRSSLKGVLKQGPFCLAKMGILQATLLLSGHRTFERQICLKNGQFWLLNVPFRNPISTGPGSVFRLLKYQGPSRPALEEIHTHTHSLQGDLHENHTFILQYLGVIPQATFSSTPLALTNCMLSNSRTNIPWSSSFLNYAGLVLRP